MTQSKKAAKRPARSRRDAGEEPNRCLPKPSDEFLLSMIPNDFNVVQIDSDEDVTLFGAERKSLFHFVRYEAGCGVSQYHVPHYPGLTQCRQRVAQLRQPSSQATAGRVANLHVLDQLRRAESALVQIGNR
ncbi:MAG TPA: hypothetical protein VE959_37435, partial [Bryobacteraceae bacterium]|nr:hypothetical protein [Bryobacteraceae bacterium]